MNSARCLEDFVQSSERASFDSRIGLHKTTSQLKPFPINPRNGSPNCSATVVVLGSEIGEFALKGFYYVALALLTVNAGRPPAAAAQSLPEIPALPSKPEPHVAKRFPAGWLALSLAGQAAAFADVKTTLNLQHEYSYFFNEDDPFARGIVTLPVPAYIAVTGALSSIISVAGFEMRKSSHGWERRIWWIPQTVQIVLSTGAALHNAGEPPLRPSAKRRTQ